MDALTIADTVGPGATGAMVKQIQEWLTLQGHPVPLSATFDDATSQAVAQFRRQRGLGAGATVEPNVFAKLVEPMVQAVAPVTPGVGLADTVLAIAERQLSLSPHEVSGRGPWVRLYMGGHETGGGWGAGFVSWCLRAAAAALGVEPPVPGSGQVDVLASVARARGLLVPAKQAVGRVRAGNLFLLPSEKPGDWYHVGIVRSVAAGEFDTIEGNASEQSQTHGDGVLSRRRRISAADFIVF